MDRHAIMETVLHLSVPVREALAADDNTLRFFFAYDGDTRDASEIRADLVIRLAKGHVWAPLAKCSNFNPACGCQGHSRDEMMVEFSGGVQRRSAA
jgi:hypothetical protein